MISAVVKLFLEVRAHDVMITEIPHTAQNNVIPTLNEQLSYKKLLTSDTADTLLFPTNNPK